MSRNSNVQRAVWRQRCRNILAEHIEQRLGLKVDPQEVRLLPTTEDGYRWECTQPKQYLFSKQLSKQSISVYMELCREVGISFEAVEQRSAASDLQPREHTTGQDDSSFSERIRGLECENQTLRLKCERLKDQVQELVAQHDEDQLQQSRLQQQLLAAEKRALVLKQQDQAIMRKISRMQRKGVIMRRQGDVVIAALRDWVDMYGTGLADMTYESRM